MTWVSKFTIFGLGLGLGIGLLCNSVDARADEDLIRNLVRSACGKLPGVHGLSVSDLRTEKFEILSNRGVYRFNAEDGEKYVVRFPDLHAHPVFEKFAAQIMEEAGTVSIPELRLLSHNESKKLFMAMRQSHPEEAQKIVGRLRKADESYLSELHLTVLPDLKGYQAGDDYLASLHATSSLRSFLVDASRADEVEARMRGMTGLELLQKLWASEPLAMKKVLIQDLKEIWPAAKSVSEKNFLRFLSKQLDALPPEVFSSLLLRGVDRVPAPVRTQLADQWAISTVLDIPDFHSQNWFVKNGRVTPIDYAYKRYFEPGLDPEPLVFLGHSHPFGYSSFPEELRQKIYREISPQMRAYLGKLTKDQLNKTAMSTGLYFEPGEVDEIIKRARLMSTAGTR